MVRPNEADKPYGEPSPCLKTLPDGTVSVWNTFSRGVSHLESRWYGKRVVRINLMYPVPTEKSAVADIGLLESAT